MARQRKTREERNPNGRVVKEKFMQERTEFVRAQPLVPLNKKQAQYIEILKEKPICLATGYAGTSKSYIPTVMAADLYKTNQIQKIIITRPAVSTSKSVGYTSGDFATKMRMWLGAIVPIFRERLGDAVFNIALERGDIEFVPLEVIKGMSINDAWLIVEEASDLTKDEVVKIVTRMGKNSKLVLAGDIRQTELRGESGLHWLTKFVERHNLTANFGFVDFNDVNDIVRSDAVRQFIVAMVRDERKGIE